jgi:alkanesulfonate monooxygenase SsuD/methylene tetrahydromethanopterin reductase-like flavin-dependent oxidoreductase (luciferase family)
MRFAISIPQFYADGEFDPAGFRAYFARAESFGCYESAWSQEMTLGSWPHRVRAIEEAAVAGTVSDCVAAVRAVADAGAELILFTPLYDVPEHAEQVATEVIPRLG